MAGAKTAGRAAEVLAVTDKEEHEKPERHPAGNPPADRTAKRAEQQRAESEERLTAERHEQDDAAGARPAPASRAAQDNNDRAARDGDANGQAVSKTGFPIIGIGASAGGLQALEQFFAALPPQSGMAFVVIVHTDPEHTSLLPEILKRTTNTPITLIEEGMPVAADTIYVPPSAQDAFLRQGVFHLKKRTGKRRLHMPADDFFKNLADEGGENAGCVILSGSGTDGTLGLRTIKERSGLVMAHSPDSALHAGMPASAIDTGLVD